MSVIKPQVVTIYPANLQSNIGESVTFLCVLRGCPSPNVTWFHNDSIVPPGGRVTYDIFVPAQGVTLCNLTISNISEADIGVYKCMGNNPGGSDMSEYAGLNIQDTDQIVEPQRRRRSADETEQESSSLCEQASDPESGEQTPNTDIYYTAQCVVCPLHACRLPIHLATALQPGPFLITRCGQHNNIMIVSPPVSQLLRPVRRVGGNIYSCMCTIVIQLFRGWTVIYT